MSRKLLRRRNDVRNVTTREGFQKALTLHHKKLLPMLSCECLRMTSHKLPIQFLSLPTFALRGFFSRATMSNIARIFRTRSSTCFLNTARRKIYRLFAQQFLYGREPFSTSLIEIEIARFSKLAIKKWTTVKRVINYN